MDDDCQLHVACEPQIRPGPGDVVLTWPRRSSADTRRYPGAEVPAARARRFLRAGSAARRPRSTTVESEADATGELDATGSSWSSVPGLGF